MKVAEIIRPHQHEAGKDRQLRQPVMKRVLPHDGNIEAEQRIQNIQTGNDGPAVPAVVMVVIDQNTDSFRHTAEEDKDFHEEVHHLCFPGNVRIEVMPFGLSPAERHVTERTDRRFIFNEDAAILAFNHS